MFRATRRLRARPIRSVARGERAVPVRPAGAPRIAAPAAGHPVGGVARSIGQTATAPTAGEAAAAVLTAGQRDRLVKAVTFGRDQWRLQAKFRDISIMAITAIGQPGCLDGPELGPLIEMSSEIQDMPGTAGHVRDATVAGVAANFRLWQDAVTVPGLPWYPSFAAFPGPQTPLIACVSSQAAKFGSLEIQAAILDELPGALRVPEVEDFCRILAAQLSGFLWGWLGSQMVMMVLGHGPVPSWAPPYVPVGPGVGGSIISTPGHLMA